MLVTTRYEMTARARIKVQGAGKVIRIVLRGKTKRQCLGVTPSFPYGRTKMPSGALDL